jgi:hypothetical protein
MLRKNKLVLVPDKYFQPGLKFVSKAWKPLGQALTLLANRISWKGQIL